LISKFSKVSIIMKSTGFTLDHLDLVVHTSQFAGVDRTIAMIQNTISPPFQQIGGFVHTTGPGIFAPTRYRGSTKSF